MMARKITFIRHAESVANAGGVTQPHRAIPLSALGHQQAIDLAVRIDSKPSRILVSPMVRAQQTAAPLCNRYGMPAEICEELAEFSMIDPSLITGMTGAERKLVVRPFWDDPDPFRRSGPDAETFAEFDARVGRFQDAMDNLEDGTLIVGHGIWFGLLVWRLRGHRVVDAEGMCVFRQFQVDLPMPNCAAYDLFAGDDMSWSVAPATRKMYKLADLMAQIPPETKFEEIDFGPPVGKEVL